MKTTIIQSVDLSPQDERLVYAMQLLGDKNRFRIFRILLAEEELCVSEIASQLNVSVPAVSQHFRALELVGLVGKQRKGQKICYMLRADDPLVRQLINFTTLQG